ncbi:hypothetical protein ROBYS_38990 [Roseobacter sp. OBYS 0001]|nr:hypothetical protein ROBYS_38990 [Roseobacter sp. OBYS 0001]
MFFSCLFALGSVLIWLATGFLASYIKQQSDQNWFRETIIRTFYTHWGQAFLPVSGLIAVYLMLVFGEPYWDFGTPWFASLKSLGKPLAPLLTANEEIVHYTQTLIKVVWLLPIVGLGFLQQSVAELEGAKRIFNEESKVKNALNEISSLALQFKEFNQAHPVTNALPNVEHLETRINRVYESEVNRAKEKTLQSQRRSAAILSLIAAFATLGPLQRMEPQTFPDDNDRRIAQKFNHLVSSQHEKNQAAWGDVRTAALVSTIMTDRTEPISVSPHICGTMAALTDHSKDIDLFAFAVYCMAQNTQHIAQISTKLSGFADGSVFIRNLPQTTQIEELLERVGNLNRAVDKAHENLSELTAELQAPVSLNVQPNLIPAETLDPDRLRNLLFPDGNGPISINARLELDNEPFRTTNLGLAAALSGSDTQGRLPIPSRLTLDADPFESREKNLMDLLNAPGEASPLRLPTQLRIENAVAFEKDLARDVRHIGSFYADLTIEDITGVRGAFESALEQPFQIALKQSNVNGSQSCRQFEPSVHFRVGSHDMLEAPHTNENLEVLKKFVNGIEGGDLVILRGHTDPTGPATANLNLAERRAENVREVLLKHFPETSMRFSFTPIGAQTSEQFWSQHKTSLSAVTEDQMRRVDLYYCSFPVSGTDGHGP